MLAGCTGMISERARQQADELAQQAGWAAQVYETPTFDVFTYQPAARQAGTSLTIVLEGDGRAWLNRRQPSPDPTPLDPIGLHLALGLNHDTVYIARPCQFVRGIHRRNCSPVIWTNARFAPEVIAATQATIDQIKDQNGSSSLRLVGFSGGGTLAALIALERSDVAQLVTIAAPLDTRAWTDFFGLSALRHSRNPADRLRALAKITQIHLVGGRDRIVPAALTEKLIANMPDGHRAKILRIERADHRCCWEADQIRPFL